MKPWYAYIVRCKDGTLYTGVAVDVARRIAQHNTSAGAKYVRGRAPVRLVWSKRCSTRSAALRLEARIKKLDRAGKLALIRA